MADLVGPIQHKRGTTAQWAASTVPLRDGEIGVDTTLRRMKVGDGGTLFPDLGWATTDQVTLDRIEAVADAISGAVTPTDAVMATVQADPTSAFAVAQKATIGAAVASVSGANATTTPRGGRTIIIGDSITAYNGGKSTSTPAQSFGTYDAKGMWRWASIILDQRIDIIGNSGIGGQTSTQIAARFATDVLAYAPDIVGILAGTNDDASKGVGQAQTIANLKAMYDAAHAAQIFIVALTIPPTVTSLTGQEAHRQGVNTWLRQYARSNPGIVLVDLAAAWQDTAASGFVPRAGYTHDGVHPSMLGATVGGDAIARALQWYLPQLIRGVPESSAPGQMLVNGTFPGTGSALPSGWNIGSGSATFSYVPRGDGRPGNRLAVTVPIGGSVSITQNIPKGVLLREGDDYDFDVNIEAYDLEEFGSSVQRIGVSTQNYTGSGFADLRASTYADGGSSYGSARYPAARGRFRTQRATFTSGKTLAQMVIGFSGGGTYLVSDAVARNLTMIEQGITAPEKAPHTSLITNRTFETDISGWTAGDTASVARTTAEKHGGAASLQITHSASGNSDGRYQRVTVDNTKPLNYVAWVKAPSGHAGTLRFNWFANGSYLSVAQVTFTGTGNWQKLIGTVSSMPGTADGVLFAVGRGDAVGTPVVYVDDVDMWQV